MGRIKEERKLDFTGRRKAYEDKTGTSLRRERRGSERRRRLKKKKGR